METQLLKLLNLFNGYFACISIVFMITRLSDRIRFANKKDCFLLGLALYTAGSLLCAYLYPAFGLPVGSYVILCTATVLTANILSIVLINRDGFLKKLILMILYLIPNISTYLFMFIYLRYKFGSYIDVMKDFHLSGLVDIFCIHVNVVFFVCVVLFHKRKTIYGVYKVIVLMTLLPVLGVIDLAFLLNTAHDQIGLLNFLGGSIQLYITAAIAYFLISLLKKSNELKQKENENAKLESLRDMNKQYYDSVRSDISYARKIRHDIANYVEQIEYLITLKDSGNEQVLDKMLNDLKIKAKNITAGVYCENQLVNMILYLKNERCRELGIDLRISANVPELDNVAPLDLSSILANMMDNAINSSVKYKEKNGSAKVSVSIGLIGDYLVIRTDNDTLIDKDISDIRELQEDIGSDERKRGHGYGLMIIQENASKYKGDLSIKIKDHVSTIIATIKTGTGEAITSV